MTFKSSLIAFLSFTLSCACALAGEVVICKNDKSEEASKGDFNQSANLGFRFVDLLKLMARKFHSPRMMSHKESPQAFEFRFDEIEVSGWRSLPDGDVVYITVRGKGKSFERCIDEIVRLCNHNAPKKAQLISTRLTYGLQKQSKLDVLFESGDLRYSLQELSGACVFHCTNARQQDRGLLKIQPG